MTVQNRHIQRSQALTIIAQFLPFLPQPHKCVACNLKIGDSPTVRRCKTGGTATEATDMCPPIPIPMAPFWGRSQRRH